MLKQPSVTPHSKENKYELLRDYEIKVEGIDVVVPKYFRYDGASMISVNYNSRRTTIKIPEI